MQKTIYKMAKLWFFPMYVRMLFIRAFMRREKMNKEILRNEIKEYFNE